MSDSLRKSSRGSEERFANLERRYRELQIISQQQQLRIVEPESQLAKAKKTSRNSSKPPSSDITKPPIASPPTTTDGKRKQGAQPGHERHLRPEIEPDQIDQSVRIALGGCPCCGEAQIDLNDQIERFNQIEIPVKPECWFIGLYYDEIGPPPRIRRRRSSKHLRRIGDRSIPRRVVPQQIAILLLPALPL